MPNNPIKSPANYTPPSAMAYADADNNTLVVSNSQPLPVAISAGSSLALSGGTVGVANFPAVQAVTGPLTLSQLVGANVAITPPAALAATAVPLAGAQSASGQLGPLQAQVGREVWLSLSGTWAGFVQVLRSADNGVTKLPLTIAGQPWATFSGNCCEQISTETSAGVSYYLQFAVTSGSVIYRLAQ